MRSSEVHRLFIQELVKGTFAEATDDKLRSKAMRTLIEQEIMGMLEDRKDELLNRIANQLVQDAKGDFELAKNAASDGLEEVEKLLLNHTEAI